MAGTGTVDLRRRPDFAASRLQFRVLERTRTPAELCRRGVDHGGTTAAFPALYQVEFARAGLGAVPRAILSPRLPAARPAIRRISSKGVAGRAFRRAALAPG